MCPAILFLGLLQGTRRSEEKEEVTVTVSEVFVKINADQFFSRF